MGALFLGATFPLAAQAATAEEIVQAASELSPVAAGAALAATVLGETLPPGLQLQLIQFLRDTAANPNNPQGPAHLDAFSDALIQATLNTALNGVTLPDLPALGITLPITPGQVPTIKQVWDTYGVAKTAAFLVGSLVVPDLAPIVLPHNTRSAGSYSKTVTSTVITGQPFVPLLTTGVVVGRNFTTTITLDSDNLVTTALDQNVVTDLIVVHAPLSVSLAVKGTCTRVVIGRCTQVSQTSSTFQNDKVFATNPTFTFAYPINAGQFPTRLTAQDAFQTAYDALGTLHTQKARDPLVTSPFASLPGFQPLVPGTGLADLATQAPPVNYFGLSTEAGSLAQALSQGLASPLLTALNQGTIRTRERAAYPFVLDLDGPGLLPGLAVPDYALGLTAGYRAAEVRTGKVSIMVVRWHNIGTSTVGETVNNLGTQLGGLGPVLTTVGGAVPASAPATIYYDVPVGAYTLSATRVDAQGAVYKNDWRVAAQGVNVPVPPTLPSVGGVVGGVGTVLGGLGLPSP
ncbi:MAG: hypothetical protein ACT4QA_10315 [Panacagrimonas sp.]